MYGSRPQSAPMERRTQQQSRSVEPNSQSQQQQQQHNVNTTSMMMMKNSNGKGNNGMAVLPLPTPSAVGSSSAASVTALPIGRPSSAIAHLRLATALHPKHSNGNNNGIDRPSEEGNGSTSSSSHPNTQQQQQQPSVLLRPQSAALTNRYLPLSGQQHRANHGVSGGGALFYEGLVDDHTTTSTQNRYNDNNNNNRMASAQSGISGGRSAPLGSVSPSSIALAGLSNVKRLQARDEAEEGPAAAEDAAIIASLKGEIMLLQRVLETVEEFDLSFPPPSPQSSKSLNQYFFGAGGGDLGGSGNNNSNPNSNTNTPRGVRAKRPSSGGSRGGAGNLFAQQRFSFQGEAATAGENNNINSTNNNNYYSNSVSNAHQNAASSSVSASNTTQRNAYHQGGGAGGGRMSPSAELRIIEQQLIAIQPSLLSEKSISDAKISLLELLIERIKAVSIAALRKCTTTSDGDKYGDFTSTYHSHSHHQDGAQNNIADVRVMPSRVSGFTNLVKFTMEVAERKRGWEYRILNNQMNSTGAVAALVGPSNNNNNSKISGNASSRATHSSSPSPPPHSKVTPSGAAEHIANKHNPVTLLDLALNEPTVSEIQKLITEQRALHASLQQLLSTTSPAGGGAATGPFYSSSALASGSGSGGKKNMPSSSPSQYAPPSGERGYMDSDGTVRSAAASVGKRSVGGANVSRAASSNNNNINTAFSQDGNKNFKTASSSLSTKRSTNRNIPPQQDDTAPPYQFSSRGGEDEEELNDRSNTLENVYRDNDNDNDDYGEVDETYNSPFSTAAENNNINATKTTARNKNSNNNSTNSASASAAAAATNTNALQKKGGHGTNVNAKVPLPSKRPGTAGGKAAFQGSYTSSPNQSSGSFHQNQQQQLVNLDPVRVQQIETQLKQRTQDLHTAHDKCDDLKKEIASLKKAKEEAERELRAFKAKEIAQYLEYESEWEIRKKVAAVAFGPIPSSPFAQTAITLAANQSNSMIGGKNLSNMLAAMATTSASSIGSPNRRGSAGTVAADRENEAASSPATSNAPLSPTLPQDQQNYGENNSSPPSHRNSLAGTNGGGGRRKSISASASRAVAAAAAAAATNTNSSITFNVGDITSSPYNSNTFSSSSFASPSSGGVNKSDRKSVTAVSFENQNQQVGVGGNDGARTPLPMRLVQNGIPPEMLIAPSLSEAESAVVASKIQQYFLESAQFVAEHGGGGSSSAFSSGGGGGTSKGKKTLKTIQDEAAANQAKQQTLVANSAAERQQFLASLMLSGGGGFAVNGSTSSSYYSTTMNNNGNYGSGGTDGFIIMGGDNSSRGSSQRNSGQHRDKQHLMNAFVVSNSSPSSSLPFPPPLMQSSASPGTPRFSSNVVQQSAGSPTPPPPPLPNASTSSSSRAISASNYNTNNNNNNNNPLDLTTLNGALVSLGIPTPISLVPLLPRSEAVDGVVWVALHRQNSVIRRLCDRIDEKMRERDEYEKETQNEMDRLSRIIKSLEDRISGLKVSNDKLKQAHEQLEYEFRERTRAGGGGATDYDGYVEDGIYGPSSAGGGAFAGSIRNGSGSGRGAAQFTTAADKVRIVQTKNQPMTAAERERELYRTISAKDKKIENITEQLRNSKQDIDDKAAEIASMSRERLSLLSKCSEESLKVQALQKQLEDAQQIKQTTQDSAQAIKRELREKTVLEADNTQKLWKAQVELHISHNVIAELRKREQQLLDDLDDAVEQRRILRDQYENKVQENRKLQTKFELQLQEAHAAVEAAKNSLYQERQQMLENEKEMERLRVVDVQLETMEQNFNNYAVSMIVKREAGEEEERILGECLEQIQQDVFALPNEAAMGEEQLTLMLAKLIHRKEVLENESRINKQEETALKERKRLLLAQSNSAGGGGGSKSNPPINLRESPSAEDQKEQLAVATAEEKLSNKRRLGLLLQRRYTDIQIYACERRLAEVRRGMQLRETMTELNSVQQVHDAMLKELAQTRSQLDAMAQRNTELEMERKQLLKDREREETSNKKLQAQVQRLNVTSEAREGMLIELGTKLQNEKIAASNPPRGPNALTSRTLLMQNTNSNGANSGATSASTGAYNPNNRAATTMNASQNSQMTITSQTGPGGLAVSTFGGGDIDQFGMTSNASTVGGIPISPNALASNNNNSNGRNGYTFTKDGKKQYNIAPLGPVL